MDSKDLLDLFKLRTDESEMIEKRKKEKADSTENITQINIQGNADITVNHNYGYDKTGLSREDQAEVDALIYKLKHKRLNNH